jgi:hypothetical protein
VVSCLRVSQPEPSPCVLHVPPTSSSFFNHPDNIRWRLLAIKFVIMQFSPRFVFLPFRSKYPQHSTLSLRPFLKVRDQVSHPYSRTGKITVLCILIFRFFGYETGRQKMLDWMSYTCTLPLSSMAWYLVKHRDNLGAGIAQLYSAGWSVVRDPAGSRNFSLHHRLQKGSGAHPAFYSMGTRVFFPVGKAAGAWSWPLTSI